METQKNFVAVQRNLYLNRQSGYFYCAKKFTRLGIPALFKTTKEKKISRAKIVAEGLIRDHENYYLGLTRSGGTAVRTQRTVGAVIDEILFQVTPTRREGTQEHHRIYLNELKNELGHMQIEQISRKFWNEWIAGFKFRKKRKTFFDYSKHMNLVLRYAYQEKYSSGLVSLPSPDVHHETSWRKYTNDELQALWRCMNEDTRDQMVLSYECFMRLREVLKLEWNRVDLEAGTITLLAKNVKTGSKTKRGRIFKVSPHALDRLRARRLRVKDNVWVFHSAKKPGHPVNQNKVAWKGAKVLAKITGRARWHDLRHTAISNALLEQRIRPIIVSKYAGVSMRTIERVYLHADFNDTKEASTALAVIDLHNSSEPNPQFELFSG